MGIFGPPNIDRMIADHDFSGLIKALSNKDKSIRQTSATGLGKIADTRAVEPLITLLGDRVLEVREAAVIALGKIGDAHAVESLFASLNDLEWKVSKASVNALGKIGDTRVVNLLINSLKDDELYVRKAAINVLGQLGDVRAVNPLVAFLTNVEAIHYHKGVVNALDKLGWRPGNDIAGAAYWAEKDEWNKCEEIGVPAIEPLIAVLADKDRDRCIAAINALGKIGDARAAKPLITLLKNGDEEERKASAIVLGKIGDARAVELLIAGLNKKNMYAREAVMALGLIGDSRAVEPLVAAYNNQGWHDEEVCRAVIKALGRLGVNAVEPLMKILNDCLGDFQREELIEIALVQIGVSAVEPLITHLKKYIRIDVNVIAVLSKIGAPAIEPLIALLKHSDPHIRKDAVKAVDALIGLIDDPSAVESLVALISDKEYSVCEYAAKALGSLKWEPSDDSQRIAYWFARDDFDQFVKIGVSAVDMLLNFLQTGDFQKVKRAAYWLGKIGESRAVNPLVILLNDSEEFVREAAVNALGQIGDARAVTPLIARLNDKEKFVRTASVKALVQIGNTRIAEPLIALLDDSSELVRKSAVIALGKIGNTSAIEPLMEIVNHRRTNKEVSENIKKDGSEESTDHYEEACSIEETLQFKALASTLAILERSIQTVPTQLLERLAKKEDVVVYFNIPETSYKEFDYERVGRSSGYYTTYDQVRRNLDCSALRKIALKVIRRRGE